MAHFFGTVEGNRGSVSRLGTKNSGLSAVAASWEGAIRVTLWYDEKTGVDMADVSLIPWRGRGGDRMLYLGPVSGKESETKKSPTVDIVA